MEPRERLEVIDSLLQKGWQSFYDFARAIYCKTGQIYLYDKDFKASRPSIVLDFRLIQDIWYCARHNSLIPKGNSTSDKSPLRAGLVTEIFDIKTQKQFPAERVPELLKEKDVFYSNPKVTFYRYKNRKYSVFSSGDYDKYVAFKTKTKNKKTLEDTLKKSVTDSEVNQAQYDQGFVPEPVVSEQIKRFIRLQEDIKEFEKGSKRIVGSLLEKISTETDQKKRRWVQKTVNFYRNVLELVKNPLSNYDPREVADKVHEFAFFLATENQYHLLGNRFDEALTLYRKLRREQWHLVEDIEQGYVTGEEANIDINQAKEQMAEDDESVAAILLSMARVHLDSGEMDKARTTLDQAESLACGKSMVRAQVYHLESVLAGLEEDIEKANGLVDQALEITSLLNQEDSVDGLAIKASKAELILRTGDSEGAKTIYKTIIERECLDDASTETKASAQLNLAVISVSEGQMEDADRNVSEALIVYERLHEKEPDRILPTLLTAKYIKGLVLMHQGNIPASIAIMEESCSLVPEKRQDLQALCSAELLEIYVALHDMYLASGIIEKADDISLKAKALLSLPMVCLSEEQKIVYSNSFSAH